MKTRSIGSSCRLMSTILVVCAALPAFAGTNAAVSSADGMLDTRDLTAAPVNLAPADNAPVATLRPDLTSSAFAPPFTGITHFASQWQVASTTTFATTLWDSGESTSALATATVGADLVITSRYCWRVRHKSNTGSWSPWSTATWLRTAPLACSFTADKTIGIGSLNVQFTGNAWGTNAGAYYYRWDFNYPSGIDWEGDGENTPGNFFGTSGVYSVWLSVSNAAGQVAYALRSGYITVLSNLQAQFTAVPLTDAAPLTVQFTDASLNQPQFWFWNFNGGAIDSTNQNPQFTYMATGQYTVALTVSNDFGAQGWSVSTLVKTNLIVVTNPVPIIADFYGTPLTGVPPLTVQFYNTSSANAQYWFWDFNNDGIVDSTAKYPSYVFSTPGAHTVKLTASNDVNRVASLTRTGYVYLIGSVRADFSVTSSAIVGADVQFTDTSSDNPTFWAWDFDNNGSVDSTVKDPVTNYTSVGWKTVALTASNLYSSSTIVKTNALKITGLSPYHYVARVAAAIAPYTNWLNAATNIQDALNVAEDYDYALISNGVYASSGYVKDGTNVFIVDKMVDVIGGAALAQFPVIDGKGVMRGAHVSAGSVSGLRFVNGNALGNANAGRGGGVFCLTGTIDRCSFSGNTSKEGGGIYARDAATIRSCLAISNTATLYGGGAGLRLGGVAYNLTIADNAAVAAGGGVYCNAGGDLWNCIIYSNTAPSNPDYYNGSTGMTYSYSCTTPDPGGTSNITAYPVFMPDYSIPWGSPCRDKGCLFAWMTDAKDLAGVPRVQGGSVDIGAFEAVPEPCSLLALLLPLWFARRYHRKAGATAVSRTFQMWPRHMPRTGNHLQAVRLGYIALLFLCASVFAAPPVVSNVRHAQRPGTKLLDIAYDVDDADGDVMVIAVAASTNRGATVDLPVTNLVGSSVVSPGTNRLITWNAGLDWNGRFTTNLRVRITADDALGYCVVDISGGPNAATYPVTYGLSGPPTNDQYKTSKILLRIIPAGSFVMGSPANELGRYTNETQHSVTLTKAFYMGIYEITQAQYTNVMGGSNPAAYQGAMRPVERVSWNIIRGGTWPDGTPASTTFMGKLQSKTGLAFDLPTEAQWEYACRATATKALNNNTDLVNTGQDPNMDVLGRYWYNGGSVSQHANVGSYLVNQWGLYDMHGNVWEWCLDWRADYGGDTTDPSGPSWGSNRVLRGGSWDYNAQDCRAAIRGNGYPEDGFNFFGFRLALPAGQ